MAIWNKHILFVHDKGQMCNHIIQYSHVYAWTREHNVCTISLRFAYKYQYFRICHTFWHNIVTHTIVKGLARMHIRFYDLFAKYRNDIVRPLSFDAPIISRAGAAHVSWKQDENKAVPPPALPANLRRQRTDVHRPFQHRQRVQHLHHRFRGCGALVLDGTMVALTMGHCPDGLRFHPHFYVTL